MSRLGIVIGLVILSGCSTTKQYKNIYEVFEKKGDPTGSYINDHKIYYAYYEQGPYRKYHGRSVKTYCRTTFVADEDGRLLDIIEEGRCLKDGKPLYEY